MEWITENWSYIVLVCIAILELVLRFKPTESNWSIIDTIVRILQSLLPNKAKTDDNTKAVFKTTKKFN